MYVVMRRPYAPWSPEELEELKALLYKGRSIASLSVGFKRTRGGVIRKLRDLGLPTPDEVSRQKAGARRAAKVG